MLRFVACLCILFLLSSCEKNWRRLHIEKRVYRDGYYVHLPWERRTPVHAYPKPQPYPVDHSRTAKTDSVQKNAKRFPVTGSQTKSTQSGSPPPNPPTGNGNSGSGGNGGGGSNTQVAGPQPSPPLQPIPQAPEPPLQRPQQVAPTVVAPPDSLTVKNDSVPPQEPSGEAGDFNFPEGEFSLVAELGFYNPILVKGIEIKPLSYNSGVGARYTIHPWTRHKISMEAGIFLSHFFISQDHHKFKPMFAERYDHERMAQFKTRFMLMDHIYVLRNPDAKFDAVAFGVFSDIGFFSTHIAVNNTTNTEAAALSRNKSRLFGLHYLHHAQFGMTARIANEMWSVFANYRLSKAVKGSPDGGDLPRLVVGATFAIGE